jgi:hypothetical protein
MAYFSYVAERLQRSLFTDGSGSNVNGGSQSHAGQFLCVYSMGILKADAVLQWLLRFCTVIRLVEAQIFNSYRQQVLFSALSVVNKGYIYHAHYTSVHFSSMTYCAVGQQLQLNRNRILINRQNPLRYVATKTFDMALIIPFHNS